MKERHGIPAIADIRTLARHEAGHLLMLWLLDRYAVACGIADGCGITKAVDEPGAKRPHTISQKALAQPIKQEILMR